MAGVKYFIDAAAYKGRGVSSITKLGYLKHQHSTHKDYFCSQLNQSETHTSEMQGLVEVLDLLQALESWKHHSNTTWTHPHMWNSPTHIAICMHERSFQILSWWFGYSANWKQTIGLAMARQPDQLLSPCIPSYWWITRQLKMGHCHNGTRVHTV